MPEYRRWIEAGATYYFVVVTHNRRAVFDDPQAVALLRQAFAHVRDRHPFSIDAICVLPDHIHAIWTLPDCDADYSMRWRLIKRRFSIGYVSNGGADGERSASRLGKRERAIWQRRYWERRVRDDRELEGLVDYVHYNPVKHGFARCPHEWPHSSFHRWVERGVYQRDWGCACLRTGGARGRTPAIAVSPGVAGE